MSELRTLLPYLVLEMLVFFVMPTRIVDTGTAMAILLILMPGFCFLSGLTLGIKKGFRLLYPILTAVVYLPSIPIYYNSGAWFYALIYAALSLIGNAIGNLIYQANTRNSGR